MKLRFELDDPERKPFKYLITDVARHYLERSTSTCRSDVLADQAIRPPHDLNTAMDLMGTATGLLSSIALREGDMRLSQGAREFAMRVAMEAPSARQQLLFATIADRAHHEAVIAPLEIQGVQDDTDHVIWSKSTGELELLEEVDRLLTMREGVEETHDSSFTEVDFYS